MALVAFTHPASAQLNVIENTVGRIENKVDTANNRLDTVRDRTATILSDTAGLQDLTSAVSDVRNSLRIDVVNDLIASLTEIQGLYDHLKAEADSVGSSSNYPDLVALATGLESLINVLLTDAGTAVDFTALTGLLEILPDQVLAVAGRAVSEAGIDATFVAQLDQAALDAAVLMDASRTDDDRQEGPPNAFLSGGTRCDVFNTRRPLLKTAAYTVGTLGLSSKLLGAGLVAAAKTVRTDKEVGIHGYAGLQIKTDIKSAIGRVVSAVAGDGLIALSGATFLKLRHCELLHYDRILLNEICTLNRGRSSSCIDWAASAEAQALQP